MTLGRLLEYVKGLPLEATVRTPMEYDTCMLDVVLETLPDGSEKSVMVMWNDTHDVGPQQIEACRN